MFFPWFDLSMLALEADKVICLRVAKVLRGDISFEEIRLMCTEKMSAHSEATAALLAGSTAAGIIDLYRSKVAANQLRLLASPF